MFTSRFYLNLTASVALLSAGLGLSSCDNNGIYEDIKPCETDHKITFNWNYNMLRLEGFAENVHSVAVFGFDKESGVLEFMLSERGDKLAEDGFALDMDGVNPGEYDLVAWCGIESVGQEDKEVSFQLSDVVIGESQRDELICRLQREVRNDGTHHCQGELFDNFYGHIGEVTVYNPDETPGESHRYNIPLKKNNNHVTLILQQLSGEDIDATGFTYTITDNNGTLSADNDVDSEMPQITYHPFEMSEAEAGLGIDDYPDEGTKAWTMPVTIPQYWMPGQQPANTRGFIKPVKVAIAKIDISRLVTDHHTMLTVYNPNKEVVCKLPLQDYALLNTRGFKDPQEYLDREDNYELTFFLDKDKEWYSTAIIINSWKVKLNKGVFE